MCMYFVHYLSILSTRNHASVVKNYHSDFTLKYGIDQRSNLHLLFANKPIYNKQVCSDFKSHYL